MKHEALEKNVGLLMAFILICVSFGGMVQILPMIFDEGTTRPIPTLKPLGAVELEGRDIYIREGCTVCHTQMVRALQFETARYGHYSVAGEDAYEHPFLWGSKRTGPDLARVGGRYSDDWHRAHLLNPRSVVPVSNMPNYPWLFENVLDGSKSAAKMAALRMVGVPYSDPDIAAAEATVAGTTEAEALIAYLQTLGQDMRNYQGGAMNATLFSLLAVTLGFIALVAWVYWPSRRARIESLGQIPLDDDAVGGDLANNEQETESKHE